MGEEKLSPSAEDYLEAIYLLTKEKDDVGTSDIASFLRHKPPSVTEMLGKLRENGLVEHEKHGDVILTSRGEKTAEKISERHADLTTFLQLLGVDKESAKTDACKIEHVVNSKTMKKLRKFLEFVEEAPEEPKWLEHYEHFVKTGEHPECEHRENGE